MTVEIIEVNLFVLARKISFSSFKSDVKKVKSLENSSVQSKMGLLISKIWQMFGNEGKKSLLNRYLCSSLCVV